MNNFLAAVAGAIIAALAVVSFTPPEAKLLWNRTESAPKGLYFITCDNPVIGDWAVLSGDAASAQWIAENGYLETDWPIIKHIAASDGDEVCRIGPDIFINETLAAIALETDSTGGKLPRWEGCITLQADQVFLLNTHPRSLDGRYFGAEKRDDLLGRARLIFRTD